MKKINLDEGYAYGLGLFETMAVVKGKVIFADRHLRRLQRGMRQLGIKDSEEIRACFEKKDETMKDGMKKVIVSCDNVVTSYGENPYTIKDYERGFHVEIGEIKRNETSPFTYMKSLNYGVNVTEKRKMKARGIDEPIFLNSRGELTEGAVTNIFFVKNDTIYTPKVTCGLLPGILREWLMEEYAMKEAILLPEDVAEFEEMFVSNSLLGIMSVRSFGETIFSSQKNAQMLYKHYKTVANLG